MIDIGPDLDIWPCFPLSGYRGDLARFNDLDEIHAHFSELNPSRGIVYDERCDGCPERASGDCHGGCRGFQHLRAKPDMTVPSDIPFSRFSLQRVAPCD